MWKEAQKQNCSSCGSSDTTIEDGYTKNCLTIHCNKCGKETIYSVADIVIDDVNGIEIGKNGKNQEELKWN